MSNALSKKFRLRKRRDFLRIQRFGTRFSRQWFTLVGRGIPKEIEGRLGLTVAKAVGKAHVRNLIKRRLRHILRENRRLFQNYDLVVIAQPSILSLSFEELQAELLHALQIFSEKILSKAKAKKPEKNNDLFI